VSRSVKVTVAGQKLSIRTNAKPTYVKDLASFVSGQLDEVKGHGRTATTQSLALLAAMNIADELFQLRDKHQKLKREVREKTASILNQLEQGTKP
jgi:cell division protein ZapA